MIHVRKKAHALEHAGLLELALLFFDEWFVGRTAAAANVQPQFFGNLTLLHEHVGIDERVESLLAAHAPEEAEHQRIGRELRHGITREIDPVGHDANLLRAQRQPARHEVREVAARRDEEVHLATALGQRAPGGITKIRRQTVEKSIFTGNQTDDRHLQLRLEPSRHANEQCVR